MLFGFFQSSLVLEYHNSHHCYMIHSYSLSLCSPVKNIAYWDKCLILYSKLTP